MKSRRTMWSLFVGFLLFASQVVLAVSSANFDFDDNIFTTGARIYLTDTQSKKEVSVSTASWANVKNLVGKPGDWQGFTLTATGLREFEDTGPSGTNQYKNQIESALKGQNFKGPAWSWFVEALSKPETRQYVTIITARLHSPDSMMKGLTVLKNKGLIPALPDKKNIFVVGWKGLDEKFKAPTPAESKSKVMVSLLDAIEKKPGPHQWEFSDDDYDNFSKAVAALGPEVAKNRWPNTKIIIHFTGTNNTDYSPHSVAFNSDGTTRKADEAEARKM